MCLGGPPAFSHGGSTQPPYPCHSSRCPSLRRRPARVPRRARALLSADSSLMKSKCRYSRGGAIAASSLRHRRTWSALTLPPAARAEPQTQSGRRKRNPGCRRACSPPPSGRRPPTSVQASTASPPGSPSTRGRGLARLNPPNDNWPRATQPAQSALRAPPWPRPAERRRGTRTTPRPCR